MPLDSLSFASSSRLRALVCPMGHIKRTRFASFFERLQTESVVRLGDVTPDPKPNRKLSLARGMGTAMFSPQGFPQGQIAYDLTTSYDRDHEYLEPFELHRRTFLVIAIADYTEKNSEDDLLAQFEDLRAIVCEMRPVIASPSSSYSQVRKYRRALFHTCLIFDAPHDASLPIPKKRPNDDRDTSKFFIPVPTKRESRITSMRTIMCDITSSLLSEFTSFARTLQSLPTIESPLAGGLTEGDGMTVSNVQNSRLSMPTLSGNSMIANLGQNRMSIQGFGSGSITERARSKGKGRIQIAVGELYLLAGRIPDALKEFVDGAGVARSHNDHLWHGKALDGIGVSLVILSYLGVDFQIPSIPYPTLDIKASSKGTAPSPKPGTPASEGADPIRPSVSSADPQQLMELIPELGNTILNLYNRSANFQGEMIPQICYFETVIRMSKFMASAYLAGGLNLSSLSHMVMGAEITREKLASETKKLTLPTRDDISSSVMRAYPIAIETMTVLDASRVLGGIASVLGAIGFKRRKAMITRELVRILIPALIQARVVGAAEAGIHPAAGLQGSGGPTVSPGISAGPGSTLGTIEDEMEIGMMGLLEDMCAAYGVLRIGDGILSFPTRTYQGKHEDISVGEHVLAENELRTFGWGALKIQVLRNCISLCEALPDFQGALYFTAQLLKMGGADLTREEQLKLSTSISRTVGASRKLGLQGVETDYWDAFLVREVEIIESSTMKTPITHSSSELQAELEANVPVIVDQNPFIYNPFSKRRETKAEQVIVQDEAVEFRITLQNPYIFDIEVESITLEVTGVQFETEKAGVVLAPFQTQQLSLFGKPTSSGNMTITGCRVKVFGCKERAFPIFNEGLDYSKLDTKVKRIGLAALEPKANRPISTISTSKKVRPPPTPQHPVPKTIPVTVINQQPFLLAKSSSLPQSALMILEGERKIFSVVFQNMTDIPVDLLFFSFQDSTTQQLQAALTSKDMQPADIYEYELLLLKRKAFTWKSQQGQESPSNVMWHTAGKGASESNITDSKPLTLYIAPRGTASFDIEALGKPGLTSGSVQLDYGYLGTPSDQITGRFFTRQVIFPITVTVNASIELVRADFIPFSSSIFPGSKNTSEDLLSTGETDHYKGLFKRLGMTHDPGEYCLMTLDLRNAWPQSLKVKVKVREPPSSDTALDNWDECYEAEDVIQAGHTSRIVLPVKRLLVPHPTKKIPSISGHQRQFVVSSSKPSTEQERVSRESFWFREEVLKCLKGKWEEIGTEREGEIELRNFRMSARMVETIRVDDVGIKMEVCLPSAANLAEVNPSDSSNMASKTWSEAEKPIKIGPSRYLVNTEIFFTLKTTVTNRTDRTLRTILRLCPSLRNQQSLSVALDLSRRLSFNGLLQHAIKKLSPGESLSLETGFVAFCKGEYEISAGVDEIRVTGAVDGIDGILADRVQEKLGPDGIPEDLVERAIGKRSWVSRDICVVVVKDQIE